MHHETDKPFNVGFIGLGVMGLPMAHHLIDAEYALCVYTRTMSKADELIKRGASRADSPASAASGADVVISMV